MTRKTWVWVGLVVLGCAAAFLGPQQFRLFQVARAQAVRTVCTLKMVTYASPSPGARMLREAVVRFGSDGSQAETEPLMTGAPQFGTATSLTMSDGAMLIALDPLSIRTFKPAPGPESMARYWQKQRALIEAGCVDRAKGEAVLATELLHRAVDTIVVVGAPVALGTKRVRSTTWRVPLLGCYAVQAQNEILEAGDWRKDSFRKLETVDFNAAAIDTADIASYSLVKPSELYRRYAEYRGLPCCGNLSELRKADESFGRTGRD
jgi:hypothetical protein